MIILDKSVLYSDEAFENARHFLTKVTMYAVERTPGEVIQLIWVGAASFGSLSSLRRNKVCNKQTGHSGSTQSIDMAFPEYGLR